jgi:Ca2+-binding EF-hand superfamily protein
MTLSKSEFADALGMRQQDLFVQRMFACMSLGDQSDSVCFQEFLDVLKRFTKGLNFILVQSVLTQYFCRIGDHEEIKDNLTRPTN